MLAVFSPAMATLSNSPPTRTIWWLSIPSIPGYGVCQVWRVSSLWHCGLQLARSLAVRLRTNGLLSDFPTSGVANAHCGRTNNIMRSTRSTRMFKLKIIFSKCVSKYNVQVRKYATPTQAHKRLTESSERNIQPRKTEKHPTPPASLPAGGFGLQGSRVFNIRFASM